MFLSALNPLCYPVSYSFWETCVHWRRRRRGLQCHLTLLASFRLPDPLDHTLKVIAVEFELGIEQPKVSPFRSSIPQVVMSLEPGGPQAGRLPRPLRSEAHLQLGKELPCPNPPFTQLTHAEAGQYPRWPASKGKLQHEEWSLPIGFLSWTLDVGQKELGKSQHGGICIESQHLGGRGRKSWRLMSSWAIKSDISLDCVTCCPDSPPS